MNIPRQVGAQHGENAEDKIRARDLNFYRNFY